MRGSSDHNLVGIDIAWKDRQPGGQNVVKRVWKNFNEKRCLKKFKETNWNDILQETEVNIANTMLEERICKYN